MRERKVKVAVIGAGTAGMSAFREALKVDGNCVLINGGPYGTTCARVGCMPSKVFIQAANDFYFRRFFRKQGIKNSDILDLDRTTMLRHVRTMRDHFVAGVLASVEKLGDKNIRGFARFIEPTVLEVEGTKIRAEAVVIASGSTPIVPPAWQGFGNRIITTEDLFEQDNLEDEMGVIGAGMIGLEMGLALHRMGISVTMVEKTEFMGGLSDPVVNRYAVKAISGELTLHLGQKADLHQKGDHLQLSCGSAQCAVGKALVAMGRKPNLEHLELAEAGIQLDDRGLPEVDPHTLKIKNVPVFLAGDVNTHRPVLHEAADEGRIAGYNAVRSRIRRFRRRIPLSIAFTQPDMVTAGKPYKDMEKEPHIIGEATFDHQGRSRMMHKNSGILRIYADPRSGKLMGAEMMAPEGEYIGHLLAWAIQKGMTAFEVLNMPYYHPTVLEGLRTAIRDLTRKVEGPVPEFDLAPCDQLPGDCFN